MSVNSVQFIFRPLSAGAAWQDDGRGRYQACRFRAPYSKTLDDLTYELCRLGVSEAVIEIEVTEQDIRIDGLPRANARPTSPRVRLSFKHPQIGPLQYPCDTFDKWQDNLRAIAKTLEAQRAMDRYGATRHYQQYSGWKALPGGEADVAMTREQAGDVIRRFAGINPFAGGREQISRAIRKAQFNTHPDRGGEPEDFKRVQEAATLLGGDA